MMGGDATAMMMAAAKLATTATGSATTNKVDDVIEDVNKKKQSIRSDNEEQLNIGAAARKSEITAKQRWNWAYNKIIMQLNVSKRPYSFDIINSIHRHNCVAECRALTAHSLSNMHFSMPQVKLQPKDTAAHLLIHSTARKWCSNSEP